MSRPRASCRILALAVFVASLSLALSGCGTHASAPGLPSGWSWYHDSTLPFEAAVPPGWKVAAVDDGPAFGATNCTHGVAYFAPDRAVDTSFNGQVHGAWQMKIDVDVTCSSWTPATDSDFTAQTQPITVSGVQTYLFKDTHDDSRAVPAHFGGHAYVFKVHSYESTGETQKIYALFDQMVGYFKYTGS